MTLEKFAIINNRVHVIYNWPTRDSDYDEMITMPLSTAQLGLYETCKSEGETDTAIFEKLFPKAEGEDVKRIPIDLNMLTKKQLAELIESKLDCALPSMERMSKRDLQEVVWRLKNLPEAT